MPYDPDAFPLQIGPLDSIGSTRFNRTVLMTAPQAFGKTQCAAIPAVLYSIHYRKVSAFYMSGSAHLAYTQWGKKIKKAMDESASLAALIFENTDFGGTKDERRFTNGTSLHFAGADSIANLAGFTVPTVVCDDEQSYQSELPGFGHPADIAETRAGAFSSEQRTLVNIGTAGMKGDHLHAALTSSAFYIPLVPCLKCKTMQLIEFQRMVYDTDNPHNAIRDTWMRCANHQCGHKIRFEELPEMLRRHVWASTPPGKDFVLSPMDGGTSIDRDKIVAYPETKRLTTAAGFWCNAFYWPMGRTWGELAADFMSRVGDPVKLKDWQQHIEVRAWEDPEIDEDALSIEEVSARSCAGYRAKTVHKDADFVTGGVDVQSGYCYYVFRGWRKSDGASWLIDMGTEGRPANDDPARRRPILIPKALDEINQMAIEGFDRVDDDGTVIGKIHPSIIAVDRGYEPDIVAQWWSVKNRGVWQMTLGSRNPKAGSLWPMKPQLDKRGRPYREIDTNQAKHILRSCMRIPLGQAGYWNSPSEGLHPNTLRAYARHMASEVFDRDKRKWEKRKGFTANHFLDCEVYGLCASKGCNVSLLTENHRPAQKMSLQEWFARQKKQ